MAPSKAKKEETISPPEELDVETEVEVEAVDDVLASAPIVGVPASAPGGPVPGRKSLGVKEPIVFNWKIVGRSGHMNVTLFKSVERDEVEAQLERLTPATGYYTNLQIFEAKAVVEQPPQPKETKKAKVKEPPAKAPERVAAKSTPLRIPGKPVEPKKSKSKKSEAKAATKPGKAAKSKPTSKSKPAKKK